MTEGFTHILRDQPLWLILLVMLCGSSMVRAMIELMPAIAAGTFSDSATGLAVLTGAVAFGAVASGLTMRPGGTVRLLYGVPLWWSLGALAAIALTQARSSMIAVVAAVVIGAAMNRGLVSTQTFVQLATPDELRGRVLSVHGLIARSSPALGALIIGFAADRIGLAHAVEVSSGALILLLLAFIPLIRRAARKVEEAG
jgi:MFS family permease